MNKANVAKMNKMLDADVPLARISKAMNIKQECLKRFLVKPREDDKKPREDDKKPTTAKTK